MPRMFGQMGNSIRLRPLKLEKMNLIDFIYFNTDRRSGGNFGERISYGKLWDRCIGVDQGG